MQCTPRFVFSALAGLLVATTVLPSAANAQIAPGNVSLTTQAEVDAFAYTEVLGDLVITGSGITNLSTLGTLTSVGGALGIGSCPDLTKLDGFDVLASVGGFLGIADCPALKSAEFGVLTSVGDALVIQCCDLLESIDFGALTYITTLIILTCEKLTSVGFGVLTTIGSAAASQVVVAQCDALTSLEFPALQSASSPLAIGFCAALASIECGALHTAVTLEVSDCDALTSVEFGALTTVRSFSVRGCAALTNLDSFGALTSVGQISIVDNLALSRFCGLFPLLNAGDSGSYTVSGNLVNPTQAEILAAGACLKPISRVMLLGDSITEARHGYATYRYFLWKKLLAAGHCVDFVGSMRGTQGPRGIGHNGVPKYSDFDQDHEGHWDFKADQIADNAFVWATATNPDLVVLHAGSVDLWYGQDAASTVDDIGRIIDELRRANPDVTILLAKLIPFAPFRVIDVGPVNALLPALVASKSTAQSPVTLIDHNTGWDPVALNIDGVHPNRAGEEQMAETWFQAMTTLDLAKCRATKQNLRIMPLGDSVTEARHGYATYRYFLWHQLLASGHCVDFVGSMRGTQGRYSRGHDGTPKYPDFDQDHEGHWDLTADLLAANAYDWVNAAQPDVVLLFAGSVDLYFRQDVPSTINELGQVIDEIRRANPNVKILMAKVTPFAAQFNVDVTPLNDELPGLVASKQDLNSPLLLVDHFDGWDPAIHAIDGVHPNEVGEVRMANTWHDALLACNLTCEATFDVFGQGCVGSAGTPALAAQGGTRPLLAASPFKVELSNLPASANALGLIGLSDTTFNGQTLPLLLTPGCFQLVSADATVPLQANALGAVTWCIDLGSLPGSSAVGLCFFLQAHVADGANTTVTNAAVGRVGVR